jgi:hypothetical protein
MRDGTASNLRVQVLSNTFQVACTVTIFKNDVATTMTVTVPLGSSGTFNDLVNTVAFAAGDAISLRVVIAVGEAMGSTIVLGASIVYT